MNEDETLQNVVKSSVWLYIGVLVFNIVGFLYWLLASAYVLPDVIGSVSAILSFESLLINVFSLGVPIGIRRFIGHARGAEKYDDISRYVAVAASLSFLVNLPIVFLIFLSSFAGIPILSFTTAELGYSAVLMLLDFWPGILASLFISVLRTEYTTASNISSSIVKILAGYVLLQAGWGFLGIIASIILSSLVRSTILLAFTRRLFIKFNLKLTLSGAKKIVRELVSSGSASWVPAIFTTIGQTAGILVIYGTIGGNETGIYHIAFAVATIVYHIPGSVQSLMFPVLSGMSEGQNKAVAKAIKLSLAIVLPISLVLIQYSFLPFLLLGPSYQQAGGIFKILLLGTIAYPLVAGYSSYVYATGNYGHVAAIDLVSASVRLSLYFALVPSLQGEGAAIAYVIGIIASLIPVSISYRLTRISLKFSNYASILLVPGTTAILLCTLDITWILGIPTLFLITSISYTRLGVITKRDVKNMALAFLSPESVARVYRHTKRIVMVLFGD